VDAAKSIPALFCNLLVGVVTQSGGPPGGKELPMAQSVLRRVASHQKPAGDYTATIVSDAVLHRCTLRSRMTQMLENSPPS
jgi:hypothetical protein